MVLAETTLIHLYGFSISFYIASAVFLLFSAVSHYNPTNKQITYSLFLLSLSSVFFGFYNFYTLKLNAPFTAILIPDTLINIGKYTSVCAAFLFLFIHTSLLARSSLQTYTIIQKNRFLLYMAYCFIAFNFVLLFFTEQIIEVISINHISLVLSFILSIYLAVKSYRSFSYNKLLIIVLSIVSINLLYKLFSINFLPPSSNRELDLLSNILFSMMLIIYSFVVFQISYASARRLDSLKSTYEHSIATDLHAAITNDYLYMLYQPKLDLKTNTVNGLEALIRWQHPKRGIIPPGDFIPIVEKTGMINDVCFWVIDAVVKQAADFQRQGLKIPIAINFSTDNLTLQVVQYLEKKLHEYGVNAHLIHIEITETFLLSFSKSKQEALAKLNELEISLSIDDYGTGYSSLSYLKQLSLTELKIDATFIKDLDTRLDNFVIVDSVIQMSQSLNIKVTAEGVESQAIKELLQDMGCNTIQGYYLSKPTSIPSLMNWMQETNTLPLARPS